MFGVGFKLVRALVELPQITLLKDVKTNVGKYFLEDDD